MLIYNICFSDPLTLYESLGPSTSLLMTQFSPFYDWVIVHCIYMAHLLYPFLCWWTFRQKETDRHKGQTHVRGLRWMDWEAGTDVYTLPCANEVTEESPLRSAGSPARCCVLTLNRKALQTREDARSHWADSLCCTADTNTAVRQLDAKKTLF